jgi:hypothetical protein
MLLFLLISSSLVPCALTKNTPDLPCDCVCIYNILPSAGCVGTDTACLTCKVSSTCTTPVPGELITKSVLLTVVSRIEPTILTSGSSNLSSNSLVLILPSIEKFTTLGWPVTSVFLHYLDHLLKY